MTLRQICHPPTELRSAHLHMAHAYWKQHVKAFDHLVDATAGGGYDTCLLASLLNGQGRLVAYDIQEEALEKTRTRLEQHLTLEQRSVVRLKLASHAALCEKNLALVVYNLGYLPGTDKTCITQTNTTLLSLQLASQALKSDGALSIMCYPGHPGGKEEQEAILQWAAGLGASWCVEHHLWPYRGEQAPSWLLVKKSALLTV